MAPKIKIFDQKICSYLPFLVVIFDHFWGKKIRFLDFFNVVSVLLRVIVLALEGLLLVVISALKVDINDQKNQNFRSKICSFWLF